MFRLALAHRQVATLLLLVLTCAVQSLSATESAKKHTQLPLEVFYKGELVEDIELSPDGTHLLALKNVGGDTVLMVLEIATGKVFYPTKTDNKQFKFNWVAWANNDRILMSLRFDSRLRNGVKYMQTRLLATDAKKPGKMITLVKPDDDANGWVSQFQDNIISYLPDDPDHILLSVDREMPLHQTVYKANVYTGKLKKIKKHSSTVRSWYADRAGNVRVGQHYDDKKRKVSYKVLDSATNKWVVAWEYIVFDEPEINIAGFGHNPNELYIFADHEGRQALFKTDLSKPGYPRELVLSSPDYDVSGRLIYSSALKEVVGLYYNDGSSKSVFWNQEFKAFQAGLDKALPDTRNYISSMSSDGRKYILFTTNNTNPGNYLFGDRDEKSISHVATSYPDLTEDVLVEKQSRTYKARDGLELEGFLSLPKTFSNKPTATIILPHGGPMSEDGKSFDLFSTFMANRGYVVFQPNFRGSSGYGHDFMMQAVGGYGLEMQDDLEDAVKYLVDEKIADPKKVCIVGASYGGYAALMGATKTPDLFQCAISFAGMSDLIKMRDSFRNFTNKNTARKQFGEDKTQLKETSPVRMAERVKIPILLIHGKDDTTVPVVQSRIMADELKDHGKVYEYVELENGTHYLDYYPDRKQTFEAMENFLKKYLPI
ncbi:alpha/beta hydrolase family protein [Cellvibrio sp. OA-2007]|uniref:alpha/beta hydrolase family protein n=1 Tax=Cellvibrio sp. OA-2007 TaxID=529823 RepID=UPI0007802E2E|nr:S9 family peptidase [Cellvibrio sp. OA-2007]